MRPTRLLIGIVILALFRIASAAAPAPPPLSPAEELLKNKGLTKVGSTYVLETDAKLPESLRTLRASKKKLDDNARKRAMLQAQVKDAMTVLGQLDRQYRDLSGRFNPNLSTRER